VHVGFVLLRCTCHIFNLTKTVNKFGHPGTACGMRGMSALWYLLTSHIAGGCYGTYAVHELGLNSKIMCVWSAQSMSCLLAGCCGLVTLYCSERGNFVAHCPGRKVCVILHSIGSLPVCGRATNQTAVQVCCVLVCATLPVLLHSTTYMCVSMACTLVCRPAGTLGWGHALKCASYALWLKLWG
jgi:hypothetical protein